MRLDPRLFPAVVWGAALAGGAFLAMNGAPAEAYPWMIHHSYTGCPQCHIDPSGGGVLTPYGRAQGDILLRSHYGEHSGDPNGIQDFAFGAVDLPDALLLQADFRDLVIPDPANPQVILMQSDLRAAVDTDKVFASASVGVVSRGAQQAWVTSNNGWNAVMREYWVGVRPSRAVSVRAGRMNLPFGIRTEDHILDVRSATRTDGNAAQQTGLSVFYNNRKWRGEVMGIAGNFQVSPDSFRDRGYSGYVAWAPKPNLEVGVSSLMTRAQTDIVTLAPRTRMADGAFARWAPVPEVAIMAEADLLHFNNDGTTATGLVTTAIVDYEPKQGMHLQAIGEQCDDAFGDSARSAKTGTAAFQWFFLPHVDFRVDAGYGTVYCTPGVAASPFGLLQAHFYL